MTEVTDRQIASLRQMAEQLRSLPSVSVQELPQGTILTIIDMTEGFARQGALQSPRVAGVIPPIVSLAQAFAARQMPVLHLTDSHPTDAIEFQTYPPHCVVGTSEAEIVEELRSVPGYIQIPKLSTNGFLEPAFQDYLAQHPEARTWVVTGDCTDICILQFATTLKAHFNRLSVPARVIVPVNAVQTFDLSTHDGDLMHLVSFFTMMAGGVEVAAAVTA